MTPQVSPAFFLLAKAPHEDRMQAAYAEISSTRDPNSGQFFVEFITSSGDAGRIYYLVVRQQAGVQQTIQLNKKPLKQQVKTAGAKIMRRAHSPSSFTDDMEWVDSPELSGRLASPNANQTEQQQIQQMRQEYEDLRDTGRLQAQRPDPRVER